MGKLGTGRNNQLSANGLLYDSDGNVFDLTEWYKANSFSFMESQLSLLSDILLELKFVRTHLSLMTDEELKETDIEEL